MGTDMMQKMIQIEKGMETIAFASLFSVQGIRVSRRDEIETDV
jgi:hypothetical protein